MNSPPGLYLPGCSLTGADYDTLARSGISRATAESALLRRVTSVEGADLVGRNGDDKVFRADYAGISFPYIWPGEDRVRAHRLRRDHPDLELDMKDKGKFHEKAKYLSAPGRANLLYIPPAVRPEWLADETLPIVLMEGEKKGLAVWELAWHKAADAAERPEFLPIAISGVWNWRGTVDKVELPDGGYQDVKGPAPDLDRIVWKDRQIIILFDSNVTTNESVRVAREALAAQLRNRKAHVLYLDIPSDAGVNGVDDLVGVWGADRVLELIRHGAYDPKKKPQTATQNGHVLTEEKLAQQFEARHKGLLHYDHHRGRWFVWDEKRGCWVRNEKRLAFHFAREVCRSCNEKEQKEFARANTYAGVERICQCSPDFAVTTDHWDRDIWLLGVPGGTVDLRTGALLTPRREDYITKQTIVAPDWDAPKPVFDKFLDEITQQDEDLRRYLQRIAGYALTGSIREEKLFFIYGPGGNGKSKFVNTLVSVAGDYSVTATMEAFVEKRGERHTTDIAALAGARMVTASETQKGRRWDEALISRLTGGDPVTARFMRRDNFTYLPQFTLMIVGNHAPELSTVNDANRRRFQIIPFDFKPAAPDEDLADKLRYEWQPILAWMIDGARDWCRDGLGTRPEVVSAETDQYFEEQDRIKNWLEECCFEGRNYTDTSEHLFASFETWCKKNGEHPGKKTGLIRVLKRQYGCKEDRSSAARGLTGIAVKVEHQPDARTGEREW